jgi:soluble cytochrome b562
MANYVLEILDGDRAGDVLPVADRAIRIGRKAGNDIVLADEKTSGVHAEIVLEGDRHVLRDLGSTNGTFLDGKRVTEMVLTPGDVVTFGRLRLAFRDAEAPATGDAGELAVRRLDAGRLQRRSGSLGLLAALVVIGLGAAGYLWWRSGSASRDDGVGPQQRAALVVNGNRLAAGIAACDTEDGWNLRAGGAGFQLASRGHSGAGAFAAERGEGADAAGFAMATLLEPLPVFAGRAMTVAAHLRTEAGALVAVRALCFTGNEQQPLQFCTGTPLVAHDDWQRVETVVAIPLGCDRLQVELVAVLPSGEARALVDDVAVTEGGGATAIEVKLAESSQTLLGTGASMAVRSVDPESPASLLQVLPNTVPPALEGLQRAGQCVLSDLGIDLAAPATERSFQFAANGGDGSGLQLVFPADAASGLMVAGDDGAFVAAAAESEFTTTRLLLGDRATRSMVRFETPTTCSGQLGAGRYRLRLQAARFELVLGFRAERQQAGELVRQARSLEQLGEPGQALDTLRQLVRELPMDSEVLAQAQALRTQLLAAQAESLRQLQQDLDEAEFFDTRGGFERVVRGLDDVVARYHEGNLEDAAGTLALRERARARLAAIDAAEVEVRRQRLRELAKAFADSQQAGLSQVVETYVKQHLETK